MNIQKVLSLIAASMILMLLQFSCNSKEPSPTPSSPSSSVLPSTTWTSPLSTPTPSVIQPESTEDAWNRLRGGRLNEAEAIFEKYPDDAKSIYGIGLIESRKGNYEKAITYLNKAIEKDPKLEEAFKTRGYVYYFTKRYDKALADFKKAVSLNPKDGENYYGLAMIYKTMGKKKDALEMADLAIKLDTHPLRFTRAKRIYLMQNEQEKALEVARQGYEAFPKEAEKIYNYAMLLYDQGKIQEAKAVIDKSLEMVNKDEKYRIYMLQGEFYSMERDFKKAEESYAEALKIAPAITHIDKAKFVADLYFFYGDSLLGQKKYDEAEKWFKKALEPISKIKDFGETSLFNDKTVEYYTYMSRIEIEKGNLEKADEYLKKCEKMKQPGDVKNDIGDIARYRADWYMKKGEYKKAAEVLSLMAQRNPESQDEIYIKLFEVYCGMKNRQEALNNLRKALEYSNNNKRRIVFFMNESRNFDFVRNDPEVQALLK